MNFPIVDGHFWIVRDGEIIDWDFEDHKYIQKVWGCNQTKEYLPAPAITQKIMISMFNKVIVHNVDCVKMFYNQSKKYGLLEPRFNACYQNCIIEQHLRGGEIVFGSFGFQKRNGGIHYEFGGSDWTTVKQFLN